MSPHCVLTVSTQKEGWLCIGMCIGYIRNIVFANLIDAAMSRAVLSIYSAACSNASSSGTAPGTMLKSASIPC